jgi:hypothetical protein
MPNPHLHSHSPGSPAQASILGVARRSDQGSDVVGDGHKGFGLMAVEDSDQFARDIAAIERAADMLRRAEPALQSWAGPPATHNSRHPLWLIIGTLWVSTALVALSAVFALYVLAS